MYKRSSFDLFVNVYMTLFALALITLGLVGPMLALETDSAWVIPFTIATGLLGAWLLLIQVNSVTGTLRRISANAR